MSAVVLSGGRVLSFGGGALSIGGGSQPVVTTGLPKFIPGDFAGSGVVYNTSVSNAVTDIQQAISAGTTGISGYVIGIAWGSTETSTVSTSPTYNFSTVWAVFNYLQAVWPGAAFGVYLTGERGGSINQASITAANLANPPGFYVPQYILNCGGSVTIPNAFGSGSTTTYPVAPIYSGASSYGLTFEGYSGNTAPASNETFFFTQPAWFNPGVTQAFSNYVQAFHASTCPAPAAYNSSTVYSAGIQVTSGGNTYTFINAANSSGHAPPNATYWVQTNQTYVGLTLDLNPLVFFTGNNDEVSYSFTNAQNFSVGVTLNPPQSVSGASPSNTNFGIQYNKLFTNWTSFSPHTPVAINYSFGYYAQGASSDSNVNVAANVNANLPSVSLTLPVALSTIPGLAFSTSDTRGQDFSSSASNGGSSASWGGQGYFGIQSPGTGGISPTPTYTAQSGLMGKLAQIQPFDYQQDTNGAAINSAAAVANIMAASVIDKSQWRIWCMNDDFNTGGASWPTYIRNAIVANQATYPVSTLRPVNLMIGATISSVNVASATSLIVNYALFALNPAETGLTYTIYRNGVSVATGQTSGTFTDNGLTQGTTYTYTGAISNSNGTGPQGAGVNGTTSSPSWKTLPVGSGGFVRGMNIAPDGTMVAHTDTNGAFLYNGTKWNQLFNINSLPSSFLNSTDLQLVGQGCFEIQVAPTNTQIFYAAYDGYIWVSSNQGSTWTQTAFTQNSAGMNPNDSFSQISGKMAVDPHNSSIVFVGTENNGLYFTINGGTSWAHIAGVPSGSGAGICGILFNGNGTVTGGATQTIYAFVYGTGLYVSNNGGSTWAATSGGPTTMNGSCIDSSGNYYVGNGAGAYKYSVSWTTGFLEGNGVQTIAANPLQSGEIVATRASGWVNVSYDSGATWSSANYNTTPVSTDIPWLAAANYSSGGGMFIDSGGSAFSPVTNGLLMISGGTGMWKCTIPASGFTQSQVFTLNDFSVGIEQLVANEIVISPQSGSMPVVASWDRPFFNIASLTSYPSTYGPVNSFAIEMGWSVDYASANPDHIFGWSTWQGTNQSGVSTNYGVSWTSFATQWSNNTGGSIAASSSNNIVVSPAGGVQPGYTLNGGSSWAAVVLPGVSNWSGFFANFGSIIRCCAADRVTANTFYFYFPGTGVFISSNGGATWTLQKSGSIDGAAGFITSLRSVPGNAGHLFYTSGIQGGQTLNNAGTLPFYRSTNSGVTWTTVSNVLGVLAFNFGAVAPGKSYPSIYIVGYVGGVFGVWYSVDNAVTWTNLGSPFSTLGTLDYISCIAADPNNFGSVFVGFSVGGGYAYYG
jgi:hypothetical protein